MKIGNRGMKERKVGKKKRYTVELFVFPLKNEKFMNVDHSHADIGVYVPVSSNNSYFEEDEHQVRTLVGGIFLDLVLGGCNQPVCFQTQGECFEWMKKTYPDYKLIKEII